MRITQTNKFSFPLLRYKVYRVKFMGDFHEAMQFKIFVHSEKLRERTRSKINKLFSFVYIDKYFKRTFMTCFDV